MTGILKRHSNSSSVFFKALRVDSEQMETMQLRLGMQEASLSKLENQLSFLACFVSSSLWVCALSFFRLSVCALVVRLRFVRIADLERGYCLGQEGRKA